jgi:peptidoglycan/LPS O-acetylase OafA/YrhL
VLLRQPGRLRASEGGYSPALDGLRALAVGAVWLLHVNRVHFPGGAVGVEVFFVLSGYLITGILLRSHERGQRDLIGFYARRAFRLYPAVILCVLFIAIPTTLLSAAPAAHITAAVPGALFYFNDFLEAWTSKVPGVLDQTWSLAVEEQFYFVWPAVLLFFLGRVKTLSRRHVGLALLAGLATYLTLTAGGVGYFLPTGHLLALALGSWAAGFAAWDRRPEWLDSPLVGCVALVVILVGVFVTLSTTLGSGLRQVVIDLAALFLVLHLDSGMQASPVTRGFASPPMVWLGARSYGVYLYGLSLLSLQSVTLGLPLHLAIFVDAAATVVCIEVSYRWIEIPVRARGRRWLGELRGGGERGESGSPEFPSA